MPELRIKFLCDRKLIGTMVFGREDLRGDDKSGDTIGETKALIGQLFHFELQSGAFDDHFTNQIREFLRTDKDKEIEMTVLRRQPKENADLQRRVGELTGQVQEEMRRREELKSRHQIALQTLQKEFTEKLAQLAKDMRDLREEIVKKEAYIKDLEEGNTRQKTTISGAEDALQQKQRAIEDLEREKTYWHDTSTKMQEMIDNLSGELYRKSQEKPHKKKKGKHSVTERKESML